MPYSLISGEVIPAVTGGVFLFKIVSVAGDALLTSPAYIITEYLRSQGIVSDPTDDTTWPSYVSYMPDASVVKTDVAVIYNTSGLKDGRIMDGEVIQHYGIQVKVRSNNHNKGWAKAEAIALSLDAVLNSDITVSSNEYRIYNIQRTTPVVALGTEEGTVKRQLFVINFLVTLKIIT